MSKRFGIERFVDDGDVELKVLYKEDIEQLIERLKSHPVKVAENTSILTPDVLGQEYLYHVSTNTAIREFVPVIGHRQSNKEDRTMPRVCTSTTILGACLGYSSIYNDFFNLQPGKNRYKGGWKIYGFKFKVALKPNAKLVFDVSQTDEHWLVTYNDETVSYAAETIGKMFYESVTLSPVLDQYPKTQASLLIEVSSPIGLRFSQNHFLSKGYYRITGPVIECAGGEIKSFKDDKQLVIEKVDQKTFKESKSVSAALLSHEDAVPGLTRW